MIFLASLISLFPFCLCASIVLVAPSELALCASYSSRCLITLSNPPDNPRKCRVVTVLRQPRGCRLGAASTPATALPPATGRGRN